MGLTQPPGYLKATATDKAATFHKPKGCCSRCSPVSGVALPKASPAGDQETWAG